MLLIGLLAGALLQTFGSRIPSRWLRSRGAGRDAVRGALLGLPLPLCSCSVLPISGALRRRRAAPAFVVAFLLATPELGVETFALSVSFLGWPFALARLFGAVLLAVVAAFIVGKLVSDSDRASEPAQSIVVARAPAKGIMSRLMLAFDELLYHIGAWMVLGVIAAAFVQALVPSESATVASQPWLELSVMTLVSIPSYICAPSATPLAAVLLAKGISPGAVMVGLLLGPATNLATLVFLKSAYGLRAMTLCILSIILASWALAFAINQWLPAPNLSGVTGEAHTHSVLTYLCAVVLTCLVLRSMWRSGTRAWVASMTHTTDLSAGEHDHAHGHGHGHAHPA
jgi:hypothetical protein